MRKIVRNYINGNDLEGLRFVFLDSLDVDPTFDDYRADYDACKDLPGFFAPNENLTPFRENPGDWDENYWQNLKNDLQINFSRERFEHMRAAAPAIFHDKAEQIRQMHMAEVTSPKPESGIPEVGTSEIRIPESEVPAAPLNTDVLVKSRTSERIKLWQYIYVLSCDGRKLAALASIKIAADFSSMVVSCYEIFDKSLQKKLSKPRLTRKYQYGGIPNQESKVWYDIHNVRSDSACVKDNNYRLYYHNADRETELKVIFIGADRIWGKIVYSYPKGNPPEYIMYLDGEAHCFKFQYSKIPL